MLLLANLLWGLSFPLVKSLGMMHAALSPHASGWFLTAYTVAPRFLLAVGILLVWRPRLVVTMTASEWKQGILLGLFAGAGMAWQCDGLRFTEASTSAFLTQFYALLIPLWVAWRGRRNPGAVVWGAGLLVLVGVGILGRFDWRAMQLGRGEWETLASSLFFMGQILCLENPKYAGNRALPLTLALCLTEGVLFWGLAAATTPTWGDLWTPWTSLPWVTGSLGLAVFCTLGAFSLMNAWQPKITAIEAGLIYCVEPVFGSIMALFLPGLFSLWAGIVYPNETLTWTLLVGGALITAANVALQLWGSPNAVNKT